MVKVKTVRRRDGHDCWGNATYTDFYVVTDENEKKIYESEDDPTNLTNYLMRNKGDNV